MAVSDPLNSCSEADSVGGESSPPDAGGVGIVVADVGAAAVAPSAPDSSVLEASFPSGLFWELLFGPLLQAVPGHWYYSVRRLLSSG